MTRRDALPWGTNDALRKPKIQVRRVYNAIGILLHPRSGARNNKRRGGYGFDTGILRSAQRFARRHFNPELFTANPMQVIDHYPGKTDVVENIYTGPTAFFGESNYPIEGMRQVLRNIFGRLKWKDATYPAIDP